MRGAEEKTGKPTKTGVQRENVPGTGRTGRIKRIAGIKTIGSGIERRGRLKEAEVEAEKNGTKVMKKKVGNMSKVTVVKKSEIEMGSALINVAAAKKGSITSASRVMNIVNTANAEGVRALIELCS